MGDGASRQHLVNILRVQYTPVMENRSYTIFRFLLLILGIFVLAISLIAANRSVTGGLARMMTKKLYFGRQVLPDHVLYEVIMAVDKVRFVSAPPTQRVSLAIQYAERRFKSGLALMADEQPALAISTIGKSQKYLFFAAEQVLASPDTYSYAVKRLVLDSLEHSMYRLQLLQEENPTVDTSELARLTEETHSFIHRFDALPLKN